MRVGFIGWRGMVGSVLMERMMEENDFSSEMEPLFFSTSNIGGDPPDIGKEAPALLDAYDIKSLSLCDILVTCQGGAYTEKIYKKIRASGWKGYWIDAASTLRMSDEAIIVLDPVNRNLIDEGLAAGICTFAGGNCTVSLMLMALYGLYKENLVEWISSMTYQAASGAGANNMKELICQMAAIANAAGELAANASTAALIMDKIVTEKLSHPDFPIDNFSAPLAGSLIPWIDKAVDFGQTREEWKGNVESNKILGTKTIIPVDGLCVRIGAMRCHSQAFTIKLKKNIPIQDLETLIGNSNDWVKIVPNDRENSIKHLTPAVVNGTLDIPVGRIHKMQMGEDYLTAFTVGDQLLWGAAEPIRRILNIILQYIAN